MLDPEDQYRPYDEQQEVIADFTGREILTSSLYEKCYHKTLSDIISKGQKDSQDLEKKYIDKLVKRLKSCEEDFVNWKKLKTSCLFSIDHVQVPVLDQVKECYSASFEIKGDLESENTILAADAKWAKDHHLDLHPTITINDFTYRGDIDFKDVREAICAAY